MNTNESKIQDFRIGQNTQIKVDNSWKNLVVFSEDCPYGKYGYKTNAKKPFNPYFFFNEIDTIKINDFLNN